MPIRINFENLNGGDSDEVSENPRMKSYGRPLPESVARSRRLALNRAMQSETPGRIRIAPPEEFDSSSFRTIVPGSGKHRIVVACPKGYWDEKSEKCRTGMEPQSVAIKNPWLSDPDSSDEECGERKTNPLMLSVSNPDGNKLNEIMKTKEFRKALKLYRKFHGCDPEKIIVIEDGIGKKFKDNVVLVGIGEAPEVVYKAIDERSIKGKSVYVHKFGEKSGKRPMIAVTSDGRSAIILPRKWKVKQAKGRDQAWFED